MKKNWIIVCLVMCFFTSSVFCAQEFDEGTKIVHTAIKQAIIEIQKKYELQLAGIKEAADFDNEQRYKEVGLCLVSKKYLSKDEGRKILLDVSSILLEHLNKEEVKPYLTVNPFTLNDIMVLISYQIREKDKDYSQFQACAISSGRLYYTYDIPNNVGKYRNEYESFEEALKLNEEVGDIPTPITIPLTDPDKPKKKKLVVFPFWLAYIMLVVSRS